MVLEVTGGFVGIVGMFPINQTNSTAVNFATSSALTTASNPNVWTNSGSAYTVTALKTLYITDINLSIAGTSGIFGVRFFDSTNEIASIFCGQAVQNSMSIHLNTPVRIAAGTVLRMQYIYNTASSPMFFSLSFIGYEI